ncbi:MAG: sulfotransferase [Bacteroidales bacterium]|nr:sulfotransferase [Bacteroidales bacterium]MCF8337146.1 sulfotransferase [Bacteroidales bacterium]
MEEEFKNLNKYRKSSYKKDEKQENFLEEFNKHLLKKEIHEYGDYPVNHPFLFIIGAPRSGTTLLSQLIANTLNISYINNLSARFFLAPLHGIRFSNTVLGDTRQSSFHSDYARTDGLSEIHEFGYFWRYWLNKHSFDDITFAKEKEAEIDWKGVRQVLTTLQNETKRPFVFKNIYGSYHMKKFVEILQRVIFIYIERDELDAAVSILNARKKYNTDLNTWWSYQPPEYEQLKDLDYWSQIAGQIYYLQRFYKKEMNELPEENYLTLSYKQMCDDPLTVIEKIRNKCKMHDNYDIPVVNEPPKNFPYRTYDNAREEKKMFEEKFEKFRKSIK